MIDIDSDGVVGTKEFRYNCITRVAVDNIQTVDDAFDKLLDVNIKSFCFSLFQFFFKSLTVSLSIYCVFLFYFVALLYCILLKYFYFLFFFQLSNKKNRMKIDDEVDWHWQDTKNCMVIIWVIQTKRILVSTYSDRWAYKLRFKCNTHTFSFTTHYYLSYLFIWWSIYLFIYYHYYYLFEPNFRLNWN